MHNSRSSANTSLSLSTLTLRLSLIEIAVPNVIKCIYQHDRLTTSFADPLVEEVATTVSSSRLFVLFGRQSDMSWPILERKILSMLGEPVFHEDQSLLFSIKQLTPTIKIGTWQLYRCKHNSCKNSLGKHFLEKSQFRLLGSWYFWRTSSPPPLGPSISAEITVFRQKYLTSGINADHVAA